MQMSRCLTAVGLCWRAVHSIFIARGAPVLENVYIELSEPRFEARVEAIVQAVSTCPNLRRLEIYDLVVSPERLNVVAEICCRMRFVKGSAVSVSVLDVEYIA